MLIDDLVVLGRACPEPLKDGRVTVCLAGWSETHGFMRIYPTRYDTDCHAWDVIKDEVEKNERDNRLESWKIVGSREEWETLTAKIQVVGHVKSRDNKLNILTKNLSSCINPINDNRKSLGIIKPSEILRTYFKPNDDYGNLMQLGFPGMTELNEVKVKRDFPQEPHIVYRCPDCQTKKKEHDQQVLEWGFYEWLRKNPDSKEQVWENAGFHRKDTDIYLFVGNQAAHRTSFMIISPLQVHAGDVNLPLF